MASSFEHRVRSCIACSQIVASMRWVGWSVCKFEGSISGHHSRNGLPGNNTIWLSMSDIKKRKRAPDLAKSFDPISGQKPHTLILGTSPSPKSLGFAVLSEKEIRKRGGQGPQIYGNALNSFWNIAGSALDFRRDQTAYSQQQQICTAAGFAFWDVLCECLRTGALDKDIQKDSCVYNDISGFVRNHPSLKKLVFAQTAAHQLLQNRVAALDFFSDSRFYFFVRTNRPSFKGAASTFLKKKYVCDHIHVVVDERKQNGWIPCAPPGCRPIELVVVVSTSPACAKPRPAGKEKEWHVCAYGLQKPPNFYRCCVCGKVNAGHWAVDCGESYSKWREKRKKIKNDADKNGDRWYV